MRFKVVDMFGDGALECLGTHPSFGNGDCWYAMIPTAVANVFKLDISQMDDAQTLAALKGREFHASLVPFRFYPRWGATPATDERWHECTFTCLDCGSTLCECKTHAEIPPEQLWAAT